MTLKTDFKVLMHNGKYVDDLTLHHQTIHYSDVPTKLFDANETIDSVVAKIKETHGVFMVYSAVELKISNLKKCELVTIKIFFQK